MTPSSFEPWLAEKSRQQFLLTICGSVGLILLGLFIVYITFWMIYGVIWFGFSGWLNLTHGGLSAAAGVVVVLLFVGNATTDREYLDSIEINVGPHRHLVVGIARASGYGWMLAFSGPDAARSTVKMTTTLLYTGPRTLSTAVRMFKRATTLRAMQVDGCAAVLKMAFVAETRVTFAAIAKKYPDLDYETVFTQLPLIDGVVFLRFEPPGITLAERLVDELTEWRQLNQE